MSSIEEVGGTVSDVAIQLPIAELSGVVEVLEGAAAEVTSVGVDSSHLSSAHEHAASALTALVGARTSFRDYMGAIGVEGTGQEPVFEEMPLLAVAQPAPRITYERSANSSGFVRVDRLQAAELRLREEGILDGDDSIRTMTVGEYLDHVDRFAEHILLSLELEETGLVAVPSGMGDVLIPLQNDAHALAIDRVIARLGNTPCYQLFRPGVMLLVADTLRAAPAAQRFELSRMMSDSVRTTSELRAISGVLLPELLGITESVLHYQHPANREQANMSDEQYAQLRATAGSVVDMFSRISYSNQFLRVDKLVMLERVRQLVRPDARPI
ncbi:MAG TPA: hypothetical protein VLH86_02560 [Patescibacteria group bacterium]|nr:hypothetical protein [Patescibacteria group bacterium]